jgi:hypothetical protein
MTPPEFPMRLPVTPASYLYLLPLLLLLTRPVAAGLPGEPPVTDIELQQFDIYREDRLIGTHTVSRRVLDDRLVVESSTRIRVSLLGFELYRFQYDARETWDASGLLQLTASVDDDGEQLSLEGRRQGDRFVWTDGSETHSHAMPVYPTNHWNIDVLGQGAVLNTLTGRINSVTIHDEGEEMLALADSQLPAIRYRYDGELRLLSWYDPEGRWLAMSFTVDDGSTIRYQCRSCSEQARL